MTVPVAPGAPAGEAPPATPPVPAPPAPTPSPAPPTQPAPAVSDGTAPTLAQLQADLAKRDADLAAVRAEARKHEDRWKKRDEQLDQQSALLKTLAEKAGVEVDGTPDPDKLLAQVASATQIAQDRARELAIFRAAASANANADALLDSRGFMARTADLDPTAADFNDRVKALVAETVAANPTLAVAPAVPAAPAPPPPSLPASSGADFSGAPAGTGQWTDADVAAASEDAVLKAIDAGLLRDLGFAPRRQGRNR